MQYLRKRLAKKTMQNDRIKKEDITGLVLAGGKGSRMGGVDKGLVAFEDMPLVEHVIGILKPQCGTLVVSANRNEDVYAKYGYPVVTDDDKKFSGPLAGIAAALEIVKTPYMVVAPCDSPFLPSDYVERLAGGLNEHPGRAVAAARTNGREQPVFMLIKTDVKHAVREALATGQLALHRWLNQTMNVVWVDFDDQGAFENMNRAEDRAAKNKCL